MFAAAVLVLLFVLPACNRSRLEITGSQHTGFRGGALITEYRRDRRTDTKIAWIHVLFVVDRDRPATSGSGSGTASGGSAENYEFTYQYWEGDWNGEHFSVKSQTVQVVDAKTVQGGGRTFPLERGNLFIVLVHSDGSLDLTQLPGVMNDASASPESILAIMKAGAPRNRRLQAVESQSD